MRQVEASGGDGRRIRREALRAVYYTPDELIDKWYWWALLLLLMALILLAL